MKRVITTIFSLFVVGVAVAAPPSVDANSVKMGGYLGGRIDMCIAERVMTKDLDEILRPYANKTETALWQSEFWGKWMLGACDSYRYNRDEALLSKIRYAVDELLKTQSADGYIGNYAPSARLAQWDVWGQKYTLLGLQAYYGISRDKRVIEAARRVADNLISQVGDGRADIATLGNYRGLAAGSVLEPMVFLYNNTGDERYLEFAKYIVARWETPQGAQLVSKAIADIPVAERFLPVPDAMHWTDNGHKAYEMMSCYIGLLELWRITQNPLYLKAVEMTVANIIRSEITITGSASSTECFWQGAQRQTTPAFLSNETCVTYTWMELCDRLYRVTGSTIYIDQIERTMYNALQASMRRDGKNIASYVPLEGFRRIGERQCGLNFNCCEANAPRGFALIPQVAVAGVGKTAFVNLYNPMTAAIALDGGGLQLSVVTDYPADGRVEIVVDGITKRDKKSTYTIALRIPTWSSVNSVCVNGEKLSGSVLSGDYFRITRNWRVGDCITLDVEMTGRLVILNNAQAIVRGPIVFARDSRFGDGFVDETIAIEHDTENRVEMTPLAGEKPEFAWLAFRVNALTSIYSGDARSFRPIKVCDFASAGNTWDEATRYKVWLTKTIETADRKTWW